MTEKVEWEVVEDAAPKSDGRARSNGTGTGNGRPGAASAQALLGPWWRWKLAALFALGAVVLVLLIALAGVVALAIAATALVSFGIARLAYWLRGKQGGAIASRRGSPYP